MGAKALGRRLESVGRILAPDEPFRFVVIDPESWSAETLANYEAATVAGDLERQADIVRAQTGIRPTLPRPGDTYRHRTPPIVEIRSRPDGPR